MNKINVRNNRGTKLWAKFALVTLFTLLVNAFMCASALAFYLPIMHNSSSVGNKYGSWGLDKSCTWCHKENTANVKLVAEIINTPNGPRNVVFSRMTALSNDQDGVLGNDARTYGANGAGSGNICEVCHRQTLFHQYSAAKAQSAHYNNNYCLDCHPHADGFKAKGHLVPAYASAGVGHPISSCSDATGCHANVNPSAPYPTSGYTAPDCRACHVKDDPTTTGCGSCHGAVNGNGQPSGAAYPDTAGSHTAHMTISGITCSRCHNPGGTGGNADHGKGNRGANPAFVNLTTSFGWNSGNSTCASASCHISPYSAVPLPITTPPWGTAAGCASCHKDGGAFIVSGAPDTGSHSKHMEVSGWICNNCHDGAVSGTYGGTNHDDGDIDVTNGYPATARHPAGSYTGTCSAATCHPDPYSANPVTTPVWGVVSGCASCHRNAGAFAANGAPATGSHEVHLALVGSACNQCHDGAVKGVSGGSGHLSGSVDVTNDYSGSPVTKHTAGTYSGTCSAASCHASPYGAGMVDSPVWGAISGCASCHNGNGAFTARFGSPSTGSHFKHMALNNAACGQCHSGAVRGTNPGNHHSNTFVNVTGGYTASPAPRHPIGTYNGTCANSCHTNGNGVQLSSPKWGVAMPANCSGCHGGSSIATPASAILNTGKHRSHMNNMSTLGKGNNQKCAECHAKTVSLASNLVITNSANHINSYKDYSGTNAGGSANYSSATGVCSTVYCHSSGQALPVYRNMTGSKAWGGTAKFGCNGCHGRDAGALWDSGIGAPNYANHSTVSTANSHEKHVVLNGMADTRGCAKCHRKTVDMGVASKLRNYSTLHQNRQRDVVFSIYGTYSSNTKTCTTYCHSNVQSPGGASAATVYSKPAWGSDNGNMTCASCHKDMSTLAETAENLQLGSHRRHTVYNNTTGGAAGAGYSCTLCHGSGYTAATVVGPTHSDGNINIAFTDKGTGTTYSQGLNSLPANGYGTCSTNKCHGRATRNWGISTSLRECEKCHGSARMAKQEGTFKDTAGSTTGSYVGTHVSHLAGTHNLTAPLQCSECHILPASINSFDHMSSLPARIVWGVLSVRSSNVRGGDKVAMTPAYNPANKQCTNTYCHAGVQIKIGETVSYQGSKPNPTWNDAGYLGGTGCSMCHGYPPAGAHPISTICSACHNHVDQSNLTMADKTQHMNGKVETTVDECLGCHSSTQCTPAQEAAGTCFNRELIGGHDTHTNSELFLAGKKLSAGDYIDTTWIYEIIYNKGFPQYACGFCHPMTSATHKNGIVELDMNPTHALRGSVKTKNKAFANGSTSHWVTTYIPNTSVVCNNVYCHSSGYVSDATQQYQFKQTPDWYYADNHGGVSYWADKDSCSQCHGNSPNTGGTEGSSAHARHVVANHFKDVFDNISTKLGYAGKPGTGAVHGDPSTATNFNCNICHFDVVRVAYNDKGSVCSDCHASPRNVQLLNYSAIAMGKLKVYSGSTKHINGDIDVAFMEPFNFKSKAQVRNSIYSVQSIYTSWTRVKGYKTYSSYDLARHKPQYVGGTCTTTSCHNGTLMEWRTKGPLACAACHNGLPQ
jgi:predicted CxxxxCH...CXXCH cytochrome family protein